MASPAILTLDDVGFEYRRGREVVSGVSVAVAPGRVLCIAGPNGAGKSTLLRVMLGVAPATRGRALFNAGEGPADLLSVPARVRARHLAYIPQQSGTPEAFTTGQIVRMGRLCRPTDDAVVERAMERAGVESMRGELFATLSAGQQQRVVLARALAQLGGGDVEASRQVILADEPCSAMDPKHMVQALELLREEAATGRGVVVVLHDLTMALRYADDALLLDARGRPAAGGPVRETLSPGMLQRVFEIGFGVAGAGDVLVPGRAAR